MNAPAMPSLFVSHGAPNMVLEDGPARRFLSDLGNRLRRPEAILVVSAHWLTGVPTIGTAPIPETIHDFHGFPSALYEVQYPAPGAPELAARAEHLISAAGIPVAQDAQRGLDHGAWAPLMLMYPEADIPVAQLSVQPRKDPRAHFAIGRALAPLRQEGVLLLASGSAVHNLHMLGRPDAAPPAWANDFDAWLARNIRSHNTDALLGYRSQAPNAATAHPTDEHLLPLFVALGAGDEQGQVLHQSFTYGSLSMAAYAFE
jgi:4,5-DOPA dioxygenase extradiol